MLIKSSLIPDFWQSKTPHRLNAKGLNVERLPVGLQLDSRGVLRPLAAFPLKFGFIAGMTFKVHSIMIPKMQKVRSYGRV